MDRCGVVHPLQDGPLQPFVPCWSRVAAIIAAPAGDVARLSQTPEQLCILFLAEESWVVAAVAAILVAGKQNNNLLVYWFISSSMGEGEGNALTAVSMVRSLCPCPLLWGLQ